MKKSFTVFTLVALAAVFMAAPSAHASSVSITYGTGGYHGGHGNNHNYKHGKGHGWGQGHYNNHPYWPQHHVYYAPRPIIFANYSYPQPVYLQPQQVTFGPQVAYNDEGFCREYQALVNVGGMKQNSFGTACLQPDGSWRIVN